MPVETYTTEFEQLMMKCDLQEPEEHTIIRYLGGLRPSIGNQEARTRQKNRRVRVRHVSCCHVVSVLLISRTILFQILSYRRVVLCCVRVAVSVSVLLRLVTLFNYSLTGPTRCLEVGHQGRAAAEEHKVLCSTYIYTRSELQWRTSIPHTYS